jgi:hypothetical protein
LAVGKRREDGESQQQDRDYAAAEAVGNHVDGEVGVRPPGGPASGRTPA